MITFPTTPEVFIAYQEQLAGRELPEREKEVQILPPQPQKEVDSARINLFF